MTEKDSREQGLSPLGQGLEDAGDALLLDFGRHWVSFTPKPPISLLLGQMVVGLPAKQQLCAPLDHCWDLSGGHRVAPGHPLHFTAIQAIAQDQNGQNSALNPPTRPPSSALAVAMESTMEHYFPPALSETLLPVPSLCFPSSHINLADFPSAASPGKPSDFSSLAFIIHLLSSWRGQSSSLHAPTQACHSHTHPASTLSQPSLHRHPPHCPRIPPPARLARVLVVSPLLFPWDKDHGPLGELSPWLCGYVVPVPALWGGNDRSKSVVEQKDQAIYKCMSTHPSREPRGHWGSEAAVCQTTSQLLLLSPIPGLRVCQARLGFYF